MKTPQYIFIHHTAVSYKKNPKQWPATDAYHKGKGWGGGGYNYEIAADGSVHQFRKDGSITAAQYQKSMNDGRAISICLDGNFDIEDPTPEQMAAVKKLIEEKMEAYKIPKQNVYPHRYVAGYKTCCGSRVPDNVFEYFVGSQPQEAPDWAKNAVANAKADGVIDDNTDLNKLLSIEEIETIFFKAKVFNQKEGKISLLRLLVAMDRMGMFRD